MKSARKMVLIPEAEYQTLSQPHTKENELDKKEPEYHTFVKKESEPELTFVKPSDSKVNRLKMEMKEVLQGKRDHAAATKMSQLLGAYLRHKESETPLPTPKKDDVLDYFEPIYYGKAASFLSKLRDLGIEWNTDKEVKLPSGEIIRHSNIVDLMNEAVVSRKKKTNQPPPHGWEDFIQVIASSSIPKSFFTKRSTVKDIERLRQQRHGFWEDY